MQHSRPDSPHTLGADLRALRKSRGLTLSDMAEGLGRSVGWLSQVERDISEPSITDLRAFAALLDVSVSMLFRHEAAPAHEAGFVVRAQTRRPIGSQVAGLVEELLSPDLTDDFEMVHSTFQPHSRIKDPVSRPTQEVGYIVSGRLEIEIKGTTHEVHPGDSFRIRGEAFRWANPFDDPAVAIWVIAPPVY
ncbi:putative HTH-type transcriptional regulator [Sulfitobacter noctilucicola]|uniref:Transcriptional regulator with XRE-family HTH domain n=1 Tax=Sulfitobacter noctilucicola TaxID=1342301 RepID=A0A7W6M4J2_9RHOB|nr:XRE family transcriptional regulator [Sulfitobacter noctilucicola]KIN63150.1 putative HTH-type transcriptional regulator [Sulfitobacter noctilucicola]MBB4172324.1 transcriptional regulator with XRE-family HTH domain [Sulfitobacter noctilucicola]